jgi:2-hydroxychromene-2-carboxylate isomerase
LDRICRQFSVVTALNALTLGSAARVDPRIAEVSVGEVISLDERRSARADRGQQSAGRGARPNVTFAFDLASPWTYLAAERVERSFGGAVWAPVMPSGVPSAGWCEGGRDAVSARAEALRMPLVWPERPATGGTVAMRVAAWAAEQGQAPAFVLAASRLAFCGGFDLDDPEILAEAAAAAGLGLDDSLRAAGDPTRDAPMAAAGRRLREQGADHLPVLRVGRLLFCGEEHLPAAVAALQDPRSERRRAPRDGCA